MTVPRYHGWRTVHDRVRGWRLKLRVEHWKFHGRLVVEDDGWREKMIRGKCLFLVDSEDRVNNNCTQCIWKIEFWIESRNPRKKGKVLYIYTRWDRNISDLSSYTEIDSIDHQKSDIAQPIIELLFNSSKPLTKSILINPTMYS